MTDDRRPAAPDAESGPGAGIDRRLFLSGAAAGAAGAAMASIGAPADATTTADPPSTRRLTLRVNGSDRTIAIEARATLVDVLRADLGLTGTKKSCDRGECGACTVLIDGRRVLACMSLAIMQDGRAITTIEGLGTAERPHPVQAAFVAHDGMQCGFCTPGQVMSAVGMLDEVRRGRPSAASPDVTQTFTLADLDRTEVRERMSGNLCRCACYPNIVDAVLQAARTPA